MGSARTAQAGGGGGGGGCRRRWLKKKAAAAAASDGSVVAPQRRRELRSFPGTAGVLRGKGSVRGPAAGSRGAGRDLVRLRSAPGSPSEQLQSQQQSTFLQPNETRAVASVLLFRHLPGARESAEPPRPRSRSPPSLSPTSLPREGEVEAAGRGERAGRRRAAPDCGRRVRCSARSRASRRQQEDSHRGPGGRESKLGKSSCTLRRRIRLWAAVEGRRRGLRLPRNPVLFLPPLPSGVCCRAAPYPGDQRG